MFFGPPTDPEAVKRLTPVLGKKENEEKKKKERKRRKTRNERKISKKNQFYLKKIQNLVKEVKEQVENENQKFENFLFDLFNGNFFLELFEIEKSKNKRKGKDF